MSLPLQVTLCSLLPRAGDTVILGCEGQADYQIVRSVDARHVVIVAAAAVSGCALFRRRPVQIPLPDEVAENALDIAMSVVGCPYVRGG